MNLGIATGGPLNLLVLDIDPRHGGFRSLADLEAQGGRLPKTFTVRTGSGGLHKYFSMQGVTPPIRNSAGLLGPGLDVRAEGGYVVVPPSTTPMGSYVIERATKVARCPSWVIDLLQRPKRSHSSSSMSPASFVPHKPVLGALQNLDDAVLRMVTAEEGTRNSTLNGISYWAGRRIARGLLAFDDVVQRLITAAGIAGLDREEIERTLWSGLTAGIEEG